jgi:hypothetical protein
MTPQQFYSQDFGCKKEVVGLADTHKSPLVPSASQLCEFTANGALPPFPAHEGG